MSQAEVASSTLPINNLSILDIHSRNEPLAEFEQSTFSRNYPSNPSLHSTAPTLQSKSLDPDDNYLHPTLASNEPLRLATLWYHLRGLHEDVAAMQCLRDKVALLKDLVGWEYAICGIVGCDTFERLATEGLPLGIVTRKESPCSHTVLQPAGTVLFLPDMTQDWRFQFSPCVGKLGLVAYAGAPLQIKTRDSDEEVAVGSLCVASASAQRLSQAQLSMLTRLAAMVSGDIASSSKLRRLKQQERNDILLRELIEQTGEALTERMVMDAIAKVFPSVQCILVPYTNGLVELESPETMIPRSSDEPCRLWEDQDHISSFIRHRNHEHSKMASRPVRAIVAEIPNDPEDRALILSTHDVSLIFDHIDLRFVSSCTLLLSNIAKDQALQEALQAKERFMRGMTHHLRTPIHGILASVELMQDDLTAGSSDIQTLQQANKSVLETADSIKHSGQELMHFVNSIIKYNHWFEPTDELRPISFIDADSIEEQILQDIPMPLLDLRARNTCVYFRRQIPDDVALVLEDASLIMECIQPILINALQNTSHGSVVITYSASADYSEIIFDIADTGHGIAVADRERIFDSYEKAHSGRQGSGLGLTLARRLAERFSGSVRLVESRPHQGAHFRIVLRQQTFACPWPTVPSSLPLASLNALPERYYMIDNGHLSGHVQCFTQLLETYGCQQTTTTSPIDALAIVPHTQIAEEYEEQLSRAAGARIACSLVPNRADVSVMQAKYPAIMFYRGPFTTAQLFKMLLHINNVCEARTAKGHDVVSEPMSISSSKPAPATIARPRDSPTKNSDAESSLVLPRCLLVDDNVINLRVLCMFCKQRNYPYQQAMNGSEAIEHYKVASRESPIEIILLDLQMPKCNGIEACKSIRAFEADNALRRAVVIIITGQDNPSDRRDAAHAGADEYFVKPLAMYKLDMMIQSYIERFQS